MIFFIVKQNSSMILAFSMLTKIKSASIYKVFKTWLVYPNDDIRYPDFNVSYTLIIIIFLCDFSGNHHTNVQVISLLFAKTK